MAILTAALSVTLLACFVVPAAVTPPDRPPHHLKNGFKNLYETPERRGFGSVIFYRRMSSSS